MLAPRDPYAARQEWLALSWCVPQGDIWVDAAVAGDMVAVRVHDTGIGIPDDKLDDIFCPFQQVRGPALFKRRAIQGAIERQQPAGRELYVVCHKVSQATGRMDATATAAAPCFSRASPCSPASIVAWS